MAGNTIMKLLVALGLDTSEFDKGTQEAEDKANRTGSNIASGLSKVGGAVVLGGIAAATAGIIGLSGFVADSTKEAMAAQEVQAQLVAVLESTRGVSGMTADAVNDLAEKYAKVTRYEDDAIVAGENMLLTFTNIGEDVFPLATETMLDMSTALGQDMQQSAIQLGKALNDPIDGVTALQRVGVKFTDSQKETIERMVQLGDVAGAQRLILQELTTEFGGSAAAAGATFAGRLDILKNRFGDLQEEIGGRLLPVIDTLLTRFLDWVATPEVDTFLQGAIDGIVNFSTSVLENIPTVFETLRSGFDWLKENEGVVVGILAALGVAVVAFAITAGTALWAAMAPMLPVVAVMFLIGAAAYLLYEAWTNNWGGIQEKTAAAWAVIQPVLQTIWDWLSTNIPAAIQTVSDYWTNVLYPTITTVWAAIWDTLTQAFNIFMSIFGPLIEAFQAAVAGDWYTFGQKLRESWDALWDTILKILVGFWDFAKDAFTTGVQMIFDFFTKTDWGQIGKDIVVGIAKGITGALTFIQDAATTAAKAAYDAARGFLDSHSPSRLMEALGKTVPQGLGRGIQMDTPLAVDAINETTASISANVSGATAETTSSGVAEYGGPSAGDIGKAVVMAMMQYGFEPST